MVIHPAHSTLRADTPRRYGTRAAYYITHHNICTAANVGTFCPRHTATKLFPKKHVIAVLVNWDIYSNDLAKIARYSCKDTCTNFANLVGFQKLD